MPGVSQVMSVWQRKEKKKRLMIAIETELKKKKLAKWRLKAINRMRERGG